jgi:hypothetical protein
MRHARRTAYLRCAYYPTYFEKSLENVLCYYGLDLQEGKLIGTKFRRVAKPRKPIPPWVTEVEISYERSLDSEPVKKLLLDDSSVMLLLPPKPGDHNKEYAKEKSGRLYEEMHAVLQCEPGNPRYQTSLTATGEKIIEAKVVPREKFGELFFIYLHCYPLPEEKYILDHGVVDIATTLPRLRQAQARCPFTPVSYSDTDSGIFLSFLLVPFFDAIVLRRGYE